MRDVALCSFLVLLLISVAKAKPIQLIYPNANHTELLINEQNIATLAGITKNVTVISGAHTCELRTAVLLPVLFPTPVTHLP